MPSSFASTVFTRKNKSCAIAACALAAGSFFLLAVGFACFGGPAAHEPAASLVRPAHEPIDRAVWVCLSAIAFSFWGGIAYLRCLEDQAAHNGDLRNPRPLASGGRNQVEDGRR